MKPLHRAVAYGLFGSLCFYLLLPFKTPVPGFSTFTLTKAFALLLVVVTAGEWAAARPRRELFASLRVWWPFLLLAAWLPAVSLGRPSFAFLDAKLLAGYSGAAVAGIVLARILSVPGVRIRAVRIVLGGGVVAVVAALLEPALTPWADPFWRWFRPNLEVWNPVLGTATAAGSLHWDDGVIFRASGIFATPNQLANFLVMWFPLVAALVAAFPPRGVPGRAAVWIAVAAAAVALVRAMTRSSLLGAGIGCAAMLAFLSAGMFSAATPARRRVILGSAAPWVAGVPLAAVTCLVLWLVRTNRANALLVGYAGICAVGASGLALRWLAGRGRGADALLGRVALASGAAGLVILAAPAILLGPNPFAGAAVGQVAVVGEGPAVPETHAPQNAGERYTETALHAGWERQKLWRVAVWMLREAPVTGPGYHRFYDTIQHDKAVRKRWDLVAFVGEQGAVVGDPHNLYLTAALAGGLPAVALLLIGLFVLARASLARAHDERLPAVDRALGGATLWYWCAFAGMSLVGQNIFVVEDAVAFFAWAALTLTPKTGSASKPRTASTSLRR